MGKKNISIHIREAKRSEEKKRNLNTDREQNENDDEEERDSFQKRSCLY